MSFLCDAWIKVSIRNKKVNSTEERRINKHKIDHKASKSKEEDMLVYAYTGVRAQTDRQTVKMEPPYNSVTVLLLRH